MILQDGQASVEVVVEEILPPDLPAAGDVRVRVRARTGGFSGENAQIWIERPVLEGFSRDLEVFERDRVGSAQLVSMSPDEFRLRFRVVDRLGHISAEGELRRIHHGATSRTLQNTIAFEIEVDPTLVKQVLADFRGEFMPNRGHLRDAQEDARA